MFETALIMSSLMTIGFILIWLKLPKTLKKLLRKGGVVTDVLVSVGAFFAFGATLTAMLAASIVGIYVSVALLASKAWEGGVYVKNLTNSRTDTRSGMGSISKESR